MAVMPVLLRLENILLPPLKTSITRRTNVRCHIESICNINDLTKRELPQRNWRSACLPFCTLHKKGWKKILESIPFG